MAAGYATRLYPLTKNKPKALLPINGIPIINYIVKEINKIDEIDEIFVVSNNKFAEEFYKWSNEQNKLNKKLITVIDDGTTSEENRKGAIGDIYYTIKEKNIINDDIIIIAGDNYFTFDLQEYYNFYKLVNKDCVCVKEVNNIDMLRKFGVAVIDNNNKITITQHHCNSPATAPF